jgi:formylglycine-generating enzyme required for sulfatase activity
MRTLTLLALLAALIAACADEPAQDATSAEPAWLTDRPANAHPYPDETLARFRRLVEGAGWRDAAWNAQGTLEAVREKTGLTFVLVPGGAFMMGSPATEADRRENEKQHRVTVHAFLLCKTECTQWAWSIAGGVWRTWRVAAELPIEGEDWAGAHAWCLRAGLRLPSEAEWEYACRAGTTTAYWSGGDESDLARVGWYGEKFGERTHVVGEKDKPNPWGLHDVHGNVWEWCEDWYEESYDLTPKDGAAHAGSGSGYRVLRGGSWNSIAWFCRSTYRGMYSPGSRDNTLGFRPAADLPR